MTARQHPTPAERRVRAQAPAETLTEALPGADPPFASARRNASNSAADCWISTKIGSSR